MGCRRRRTAPLILRPRRGPSSRPASCAHAPGRYTAHLEKTAAPAPRSLPRMIKLTNFNVWVHDQDEALAFYTQKLGWEVRADVTLAELGDFRWLTVAPPGQAETAVVLMAIPGPPVLDADTSAKVAELMAKGAAGTVFLTTD